MSSKILPAETLAPPETEPFHDDPFDFTDERDSNFEIEVSDFKFVTRGIKNGKALRFTVTWKFEHPKYGLLGESEEGWLCTRNRGNYLRVNPPVSRFGPMQSKQLKMITAGYHDLILGMITSYKTKSGASYADYIGNVMNPELQAKLAQEIDPELPTEISEK